MIVHSWNDIQDFPIISRNIVKNHVSVEDAELEQAKAVIRA